MSKWTAASDYDYEEEANPPVRRPPTVKCAHCGSPVELEAADTYKVQVLCRCCKEER